MNRIGSLGPGAMARPWLLSGALILASTLSAASAPVDERAERRLTMMLLTLDMAQTACGFRVVQPRLAALLSSAGVTREQLYGRPITPALQENIDGLQNAFARTAAAACAEAWRQYGPSSDTSVLAR